MSKIKSNLAAKDCKVTKYQTDINAEIDINFKTISFI